MALQFRRHRHDEPEINLIPFIDVLLVVLIFLMLSTTYSKFTELQLTLPQASSDATKVHPQELVVAVGADGTYSINRKVLSGPPQAALLAALTDAATTSSDTVVVISADASARHQSVVTVLDAARRAGLNHITFATQSANAP